eukprot:CAMPEP_0117693572 /NCGR_PEP_ID=MMETSP0804-20121206/26957_1 /TAXON_ID=1074897 /ORGANISM="Tetraselmis astigmatica, Strain CCMP880" /LENGTH=122 /DNA_ID=CAMNT_0005507145 /DNA_START=317 /DNA_END=681 /DNA_ORIENTATION=-
MGCAASAPETNSRSPIPPPTSDRSSKATSSKPNPVVVDRPSDTPSGRGAASPVKAAEEGVAASPAASRPEFVKVSSPCVIEGDQATVTPGDQIVKIPSAKEMNPKVFFLELPADAAQDREEG